MPARGGEERGMGETVMGESRRRAAVTPIYCDAIDDIEARDGLIHFGLFVKSGNRLIVQERVVIPPPALVIAGKKFNAVLRAMWRNYDG